MTSDCSKADRDRDWQLAVGKAILSFGNIELVIIRCFELIQDHGIAPEVVYGDKFKLKANKLIPKVNTFFADKALKRQFGNKLRAAVALADTRNLIAHNPVMLEVFTNDDESMLKVEHQIRGIRKTNVTMNLEQLKEFADQVESLSSELWLAFCELAKDSNALWRKNPQ